MTTGTITPNDGRSTFQADSLDGSNREVPRTESVSQPDVMAASTIGLKPGANSTDTADTVVPSKPDPADTVLAAFEHVAHMFSTTLPRLLEECRNRGLTDDESKAAMI